MYKLQEMPLARSSDKERQIPLGHTFGRIASLIYFIFE